MIRRWALGKVLVRGCQLVNFFVDGPRRMSLARRLGFCENGVEYAVLAVFEGGEV
jgi:hypothetical protein